MKKEGFSEINLKRQSPQINTYPQCVSRQSRLFWCNLLSFSIGCRDVCLLLKLKVDSRRLVVIKGQKKNIDVPPFSSQRVKNYYQ